MAIQLIGPTIHVIYDAGALGVRPCLLCGRSISTHGSAPQSHAEKHVREGTLEEIRRPDTEASDMVVGYRTPGAPGFYAVWIDRQGQERAAHGSAGPVAAHVEKATRYHMGRDTEKRIKRVDE